MFPKGEDYHLSMLAHETITKASRVHVSDKQCHCDTNGLNPLHKQAASDVNFTKILSGMISISTIAVRA